VCNEEWIDGLPGSFYQYLPNSTSDHSPMSLHLLTSFNSGTKPFRYFNAGFSELVQKTWNLYTGSPGSYEAQ